MLKCLFHCTNQSRITHHDLHQIFYSHDGTFVSSSIWNRTRRKRF
jgi:hypothetical protein